MTISNDDDSESEESIEFDDDDDLIFWGRGLDTNGNTVAIPMIDS